MFQLFSDVEFKNRLTIIVKKKVISLMCAGNSSSSPVWVELIIACIVEDMSVWKRLWFEGTNGKQSRERMGRL